YSEYMRRAGEKSTRARSARKATRGRKNSRNAVGDPMDEDEEDNSIMEAGN
ncbi:hypothetical protein HDU93_006071, partial [Gonapodya sp. JEL0774]